MIYLKMPYGREYSVKQYAYTGEVAACRLGMEESKHFWSPLKFLANVVEIKYNVRRIDSLVEAGKEISIQYTELQKRAMALKYKD